MELPLRVERGRAEGAMMRQRLSSAAGGSPQHRHLACSRFLEALISVNQTLVLMDMGLRRGVVNSR